MNKKYMGVFNIFLGFLVLTLPAFTELTYLKFVMPYILVSLLFLLILIIGFEYMISYFLLFGFMSIFLLISNYYFSYEIIFGFLFGSISSLLIYFYTGADSYE